MPTTPTYPGVYIEEIPSGVRTITGVATSIAAFVDYFERGLMNQAVQLFNMGDFQREFGGLNSQSEASYAIQQFFLNGGTEAWVVRVASDDPVEAQVEIGSVIEGGTSVLTVMAISPGEWGNRLRVRVDSTMSADGVVAVGRFDLTVSDYAAVGGRNVLVGQEVHRNLSMNPDEKTFVETVVNDPNTGSKFVRVKANTMDSPLVNGTLSGPLADSPEVPASPKLRVVVGNDRVTAALRFRDDVALPGQVLLTTVAPTLQSALRGSRPANPVFADATVEVVGNRLRILAGSDDPTNRVAFEDIQSSSLAEDLLLTGTEDSIRKATLSDNLGLSGPQIPAAAPVNVSDDGGTPSTTVAMDFSDLGLTLPGPVERADIASKLQEAISAPATDLEGIEVHVLGSTLCVLSAEDAADPVEFANTPGTTIAEDDLLLTGTDVSNRMATLSGWHAAEGPLLGDTVELQVTVDGDPNNAVTVSLDFSDLEGTPPRHVPLERIASRLETAIAAEGVTGVEVHVIKEATEERLLVLSAEDAADPVEFDNTTGTTTADDLLLTGTDVSNRMATLSGTLPTKPRIPAAPPVDVEIDGTPATAALVFQAADAVTLPGQVSLAKIREKLEAAIKGAHIGTAFSEAIVAIVRDDRLLVLPGDSATGQFEFADTPGTNTAQALRLTGAATLTATLSGVLADAIEIFPDPEIDMTVDGGTTPVTLAPDFSDLDPLPLDVSLEEIARRLQSTIRRAGSNNPSLRNATIHVVTSDGNRLTVLPGGTSPDIQIEFATTSANETASKLSLTATATTDTATANLKEYPLGGGVVSDTAQVGGRQGTNGVPPDGGALRGNELEKTGINALEDVDLFNMLCIPRVAELPATEAFEVISKAHTYCEKRRAFFLIDTPKGIDEPQEVKNWVAANIPRHRNAAFFYPRVRIADPLEESRLRSVGASGTMAGLFARIDSTRGVWKAPAGTEATLVNVSQLDDVLTDQENGTLNPLAINCLRNFPIYGNVSWGARTLDGSDQQASEWKYIPVRRLALFLEESLYRGIKWVVFEPNDEPLWAQIRLNVGAFMQNLFRQGAFQGQTPREAYFVKCDGETTTQNDINLGIVNILVGFAPLKPAEFVILKIQQMAGQIET